MKKPLQRQPFAAFTVMPSGIDGAVRHENGCAKYCTKPRNWKVSAVIRYEDGDVIREDVVRFQAEKAMPTDFTAEMYRHLNERIAGRRWYFARVTCRPVLS